MPNYQLIRYEIADIIDDTIEMRNMYMHLFTNYKMYAKEVYDWLSTFNQDELRNIGLYHIVDNPAWLKFRIITLNMHPSLKAGCEVLDYQIGRIVSAINMVEGVPMYFLIDRI